jgi:predicted nucleotidyltransferase
VPSEPTSALLGKALREFARALRARFGDRLVGLQLFGSYARNEAHAESDVDVAVVLDCFDWQTRADVIDLATDIGLEHDLLISPTVFDRTTYDRLRREERALVMDIERKGRPL